MKAFVSVLAALAIGHLCAAEDIKCGTQAPGNEPIGGFRQYIGGGIHAKPHSWPWAAAILGDDGSEPLEHCGASIIDKRWVITAGHCGAVLKGVHIKVGADDRGTSIDINEPSQQVFGVEKFFVNPKWDDQTLTFDTTVVKLDKDIEFNDNVRPICLPDASETLAAGEWATTIGWGLQENDHPPEHRELQQLKLPVVDSAACDKTIQENYPGAPHVDPNSMVCAGFPDIHNSTGIYAGDSGSALMAKHGDAWKLYGVTSWRVRWDPYLPGVWAYVPKMVDWIKETIASN